MTARTPKTAKDAREFRGPGGETDGVASAVLQAAIEVHRVLGPGFLESVYEQALDLELTLRRIRFVRQPAIAVVYKDPGVLGVLAVLSPVPEQSVQDQVNVARSCVPLSS